MALNFDEAFERVVGHEGGFQNMKEDRGNWTSGQVGVGELKGTKFGIAAHSYPNLDIKNLTVEQAKQIYLKDFWEPLGSDRFPPEVLYQLFDASFNHGIRTCFKMLQRAVGVKDDGAVGPATMAAYKKFSDHDFLKYYLAERIEFMTKLNTFYKFGAGWMNRIAQNLRYAAKDTEG